MTGNLENLINKIKSNRKTRLMLAENLRDISSYLEDDGYHLCETAAHLCEAINSMECISKSAQWAEKPWMRENLQQDLNVLVTKVLEEAEKLL